MARNRFEVPAAHVIAPHERGIRMEAQHMCPDCTQRSLILLCRWCSGSGIVTEAQLEAWQADQNRQMAAGG